MNVIINVEILILVHKSISQYAPNVYFQQPEQYTRGAYFEKYDDQEYKWSRKQAKLHRKRKKYTDYYISAELDYGPKRLKCKCSCKKCGKEKPSYDKEREDCCPSTCDSCPGENGLSTIYTPSTIPIKFPKLYCVLYPWIGCDENVYSTDEVKSKDSKEETDKKDKDEKDKKYKDDKSKEDKDGKGKKDTDDKDKGDKDDKGKVDKDDKGKEDKDDKGKKDKDDKGKEDKDDKDKVDKDDKGKEDKDDKGKGDKDDKGKEDEYDKSKVDKDDKGKEDEDDDSKKDKDKKDKVSHKDLVTGSTVPYHETYDNTLFLKHFSKKKKCLRNNCLRDNTESKIGRYFYNDLIMRPTVNSYLHKNGANSNINSKSFDEVPHYGIVPIPDHLVKKIMHEVHSNKN